MWVSDALPSGTTTKKVAGQTLDFDWRVEAVDEQYQLIIEHYASDDLMYDVTVPINHMELEQLHTFVAALVARWEIP